MTPMRTPQNAALRRQWEYTQITSRGKHETAPRTIVWSASTDTETGTPEVGHGNVSRPNLRCSS
jgi:hypothetical protein